MVNHMDEHTGKEEVRIGSKEWWIRHIESRNKALSGNLQIINGSSNEPFLYVTRKNSGKYPEQGKSSDEKYLKDCFLGIGLFDKRSTLLEESVKLGNYKKKIDAVAEGFDKSHFVIEFKVVAEKRETGEGRMPINIEKMGASIGQALLYCASYIDKYPSQKWGIIPIVCTWSLGSGSSHIIELCKKVGITMINLDPKSYMPNGPALKIYYLGDNSPRLFA